MAKRTPFSSAGRSRHLRVRWTPRLQEALGAAVDVLGRDADAAAVLEHMGPAAAGLCQAAVDAQLQKHHRGLERAASLPLGAAAAAGAHGSGGWSLRALSAPSSAVDAPSVGSCATRGPRTPRRRGTMSLPIDMERDFMPRAPSLPLIEWGDLHSAQAGLQPHELQRCAWAPAPIATGGDHGHMPASLVTGLPQGRVPAPSPSHCSVVTSGMPEPYAAAAGGAAGDSGGASTTTVEPHDGDDFAVSLRSAVEEFTTPDLMACYSDSEGGSSLWSTDTPTYPRLESPPPPPQHVLVTTAAAGAAPPAPALCTFVPTTTTFPPTLPPLQQLRPAPCGVFAAAPARYEDPPPAYQEKLAALMAAMHERPGVAPIGLKLDKQAVLRELRLAAA